MPLSFRRFYYTINEDSNTTAEAWQGLVQVWLSASTTRPSLTGLREKTMGCRTEPGRDGSPRIDYMLLPSQINYCRVDGASSAALGRRHGALSRLTAVFKQKKPLSICIRAKAWVHQSEYRLCSCHWLDGMLSSTRYSYGTMDKTSKTAGARDIKYCPGATR